MTGPAAGAGRPFLSPPGCLRPLSAPMAALLREGDTEGRYASRSEAVLATALAAASADWTEADWRTALAAGSGELAQWALVQRRKTGTHRQRAPADSERRLSTTWAKAHRRVVARPPVADHFTVRAELAELLATADADPAAWRGAAGVTNRAVLGALAEIAAAACTLTPSASTRQLAEAANVAAGTAWCALRRLAAAGWIRQEHAAAGTEAATWRLLRPDTAPHPTAAVAEVLEALPPRPATPPGGSTRAHDAFTHPIHGGLGRVAARIFDLLDDGVYGGLSLTQLVALSGLHPRTVTRHLDALQAVGLVAVGGLSGGWARSSAAGDPDRLAGVLAEAAAALGCAGVGATRRARHAAQREAYTAWWTDFHARAGWACQRGRYRPEQPALPLPIPRAA